MTTESVGQGGDIEHLVAQELHTSNLPASAGVWESSIINKAWSVQTGHMLTTGGGVDRVNTLVKG